MKRCLGRFKKNTHTKPGYEHCLKGKSLLHHTLIDFKQKKTPFFRLQNNLMPENIYNFAVGILRSVGQSLEV